MEAGVSEGLTEYVAGKSTPPPFLVKTYTVVEDPSTDDVISWNSDGTAFVVWQTVELAKDILPKLFKHSNFSSFVRQLNTYGFRKVATSRWEFYNDKFQKGKKEKLCEIRRRKAWTSNIKQQATINEPTQAASGRHENDRRSSSSNSSSDFSSRLVDENKRLEKENGDLSSELAAMKRKRTELLDLVAEHENGSYNSERPKLFGVWLEAEGKRKRKRAEERSN